MDEFKQKLLEKSYMFWVRVILRTQAWAVLTFMVVFTIIKPIMAEKEIHFTTGDKQVYFWSILTVLSIESIKKIYDLFIEVKFGSKKLIDKENKKEA